jgi:hypothetical protein
MIESIETAVEDKCKGWSGSESVAPDHHISNDQILLALSSRSCFKGVSKHEEFVALRLSFLASTKVIWTTVSSKRTAAPSRYCRAGYRHTCKLSPFSFIRPLAILYASTALRVFVTTPFR